MNRSFPKWQDDLINLVRDSLEGLTLDTKKILPKIDKKNKKAMPFIMSLKKDIEAAGNVSALDRKLAFDEKEVLELIKPALAATVYKCLSIEIVEVDPNAADLTVAAQGAIPGMPGIDFANV
jgi:leucyl-tRNA synthetase